MIKGLKFVVTKRNKMESIRNKTVADFVTENIHTSNIFKKYGIDFCFNGKVSIENVCFKNDLDYHELESELALTIADEWHHKNIDILIMEPLIKYAKNNGIKRLYTFEFAENYAMRKIAKKLGMTAKTDPDDSQLIVYSLNI